MRRGEGGLRFTKVTIKCQPNTLLFNKKGLIPSYPENSRGVLNIVRQHQVLLLRYLSSSSGYQGLPNWTQDSEQHTVTQNKVEKEGRKTGRTHHCLHPQSHPYLWGKLITNVAVALTTDLGIYSKGTRYLAFYTPADKKGKALHFQAQAIKRCSSASTSENPLTINVNIPNWCSFPLQGS